MHLADRISYFKYMVMNDWWILFSGLYEKTNILYIKLPLVKYRQHLDNLLGYKKFNILILIIRLITKFSRDNKNVKEAYTQSKEFYYQGLLKTAIYSAK